MSIQAVIVMSISISVLLWNVTNDWWTYVLCGVLISWAVIITDMLTGRKD